MPAQRLLGLASHGWERRACAKERCHVPCSLAGGQEGPRRRGRGGALGAFGGWHVYVSSCLARPSAASEPPWRGERPAQSLGVVSTQSAASAAVWGEGATRCASAKAARPRFPRLGEAGLRKGEVPCPPHCSGGAGGPSAPRGGWAPRRKGLGTHTRTSHRASSWSLETAEAEGPALAGTPRGYGCLAAAGTEARPEKRPTRSPPGAGRKGGGVPPRAVRR